MMNIEREKLEQVISYWKELYTISNEVSNDLDEDEFVHGYAVGQKSAYEEAIFSIGLLIKEAAEMDRDA
jgi:hypothetical protein